LHHRVSAGSIVAAAYASGAQADDIAQVAPPCGSETWRWSLCRMGFMGANG